jgi:hypothetical protein
MDQSAWCTQKPTSLGPLLASASLSSSAGRGRRKKRSSRETDSRSTKSHGDGTLTPGEVPSALFARMDKNKNGVVTFEEPKAFYAGRRTTP